MDFNIFNIPFYEDGLLLLCHHLRNKSQHNPLDLSRTTVLLPTRRACRRLQSLFLEHDGRTSTVLPELVAFGDLGQTLFQKNSFFSKDEALGKVLGVLTHDGTLSLSEAFPLAKAFLDLEKEGSLCDINWHQDLKALFPDELAKHRQSSLLHLENLIRQLRNDLPFFPGALQVNALKTFMSDDSSNSQKAHTDPLYAYALFPKNDLEQDFLYRLSSSQKGMVWLSGLDRQVSEKEFEAIKPPHPQASHATFLKALSLKRKDIPDWRACRESQSSQTHHQANLLSSLKDKFVSKVFRETFTEAKPVSGKTGISSILCQDSPEEARLISLAMRKTLETPFQKALFVTSDPFLARSVTEELKRYDLYPDTGSGFPFIWTEAGSFLSLILEALTSRDEFAKLCLFKHPLFRMEETAGDSRSKARLFELLNLRNLSPESLTPDLKSFLFTVDKTLAPLKKLLKGKQDLHRPADLFQTHLQICEALSRNEKGQLLIWSKEVGNLAFEACSSLLKMLSHLPPIKASDYGNLIYSLLKTQTIRQSHSVHPRLLILDPDQASLQKADLLILGGMTEGTWPRQNHHDPWLSREMKQALSINTQTNQRSLDSHLFTEFLVSFPRVLITMPGRTIDGPQKASPFLKRLETAAKSEGICLASSEPLQDWAKALVTMTSTNPQLRPKPVPTFQQRPRKISITDVETLNRNPYLFYAQRVLKLHPFPELQGEPGPALYGTLLHEVFESFLSQKDRSLEKLIALGQEKMAPFQDNLSVRYFWQNRFESCARWFLDQQQSPGSVQHHFLEWSGSLRRSLPNPTQNQKGFFQETLTLSGKADRLDQKDGGTISIIDYKSGRLPSRKEIMEGQSVQLALEALILQEGGFKDLPLSSKLNSLEYWHLKEPCKRVTYTENLDDLVRKADSLLDSLISTYYKDLAPFSAPCDTGNGHDYDPLIRTQEWLSNVA